MAKELKGGSLEGYSDLALAMQRNKEKRSGILSYLEAKYGNGEDNDSGDDLVVKSKASTKRGKGKDNSSTTSKNSKRQKKQ